MYGVVHGNGHARVSIEFLKGKKRIMGRGIKQERRRSGGGARGGRHLL